MTTAETIQSLDRRIGLLRLTVTQIVNARDAMSDEHVGLRDITDGDHATFDDWAAAVCADAIGEDDRRRGAAAGEPYEEDNSLVFLFREMFIVARALALYGRFVWTTPGLHDEDYGWKYMPGGVPPQPHELGDVLSKVLRLTRLDLIPEPPHDRVTKPG